MKAEEYDIIICGAGMAGLSLAYRALNTNLWKDKKILIIDRAVKERNDRTWCFWQKERSEFEDVIYKTWDDMRFFSNSGQAITLENKPYQYKMIRGIDFYNYTLSFLSQLENVFFIYDEVKLSKTLSGDYQVSTPTATYHGEYIFNSVYSMPEAGKHQYFLQHFKGVTIRTNQFSGRVNEIHLMDFRTSQSNGCSFFYVLPFAGDTIFIEYTLFSKRILAAEEYDEEIKKYINNVLKISEYEILEDEFGIIPMTDYPFKRNSGNLINIGTAGGDTRGSTGYTFTNTQKTISKIINSFKLHDKPFFAKENIRKKHMLYDAIILNVLDENEYKADEIFTAIFKHTKAKTVFKFLDSESTLAEDLGIITSLKPLPFLRAFFKVLAGYKL